MAGEVGTQMDGLKMVPASTQGPAGAGIVPSPQPSPQPSPNGRGSEAAAALPTGGEPVKSEASAAAQGTAAFNPDAFLAQIQAVLDERDRRLQSSLDKRDKTIRQMLKERQGQVQAIGEKAKTLGVSDQQVQSLQSALLSDALAEAMKEEDPPSPQDHHPSPLPQGEGAAAEVAAAEARAEAMAELAGLTQDDPEVQLITGYATPAEYLAKVKEACAAKMRRTLGVTTPTLTSPVVPTGEGLKVSPNGHGSAVGAAAMMGPGASAADVLPPLARVEAGSLWRRALQEEAERRSR